MDRPVHDKAQVELDFPDRSYVGTFGRSAEFDAHLDRKGVSLTLHNIGDVRKAARMHFHYRLFADILRSLANTVSGMPDTADGDSLRGAAEGLALAIEARLRSAPVEADQPSAVKDDPSAMTADEEVLLLHLME